MSLTLGQFSGASSSPFKQSYCPKRETFLVQAEKKQNFDLIHEKNVNRMIIPTITNVFLIHTNACICRIFIHWTDELAHIACNLNNKTHYLTVTNYYECINTAYQAIRLIIASFAIANAIAKPRFL